MRRFIERSCAEDPRITVSRGDPMAHYLQARLCAHPSYEDGFAYAGAEAWHAGVPVLVSQDTGMKDLVDPGRTGEVLPTGDVQALTQAIDACYRARCSVASTQQPERPDVAVVGFSVRDTCGVHEQNAADLLTAEFDREGLVLEPRLVRRERSLRASRRRPASG